MHDEAIVEINDRYFTHIHDGLYKLSTGEGSQVDPTLLNSKFLKSFPENSHLFKELGIKVMPKAEFYSTEVMPYLDIIPEELCDQTITNILNELNLLQRQDINFRLSI